MSRELTVTLRLGEPELRALEARLRDSATLGETESESALLAAALETAERARASKAPAFVLERIDRLEELADMLADPDWDAPKVVREHARVVLAYFRDSRDLIPDDAPVFGFLDDAVMMEILTQRFDAEFAAYAKFRRERDRSGSAEAAVRDRRLREARRKLRARIREQEREATEPRRRARLLLERVRRDH